MNYASLVRGLLTVCTVILSCGTLACLIRAILGPSTADRSGMDPVYPGSRVDALRELFHDNSRNR